MQSSNAIACKQNNPPLRTSKAGSSRLCRHRWNVIKQHDRPIGGWAGPGGPAAQPNLFTTRVRLLAKPLHFCSPDPGLGQHMPSNRPAPSGRRRGLPGPKPSSPPQPNHTGAQPALGTLGIHISGFYRAGPGRPEPVRAGPGRKGPGQTSWKSAPSKMAMRSLETSTCARRAAGGRLRTAGWRNAGIASQG